MSSRAEDELVPIPAAGRVFGLVMRPGLADCAPSGRMRLDAMARWFQDVAWADINDAGVGAHAFWILRRTRIRVSQFPQINEPHNVQTFCSGIGRLVAERRTVISAVEHPHQPLVDACSLWVHLNPRTRRPSNLSPEELAIFAAAADTPRTVGHRLRHPRPEAQNVTHLFDWRFRHVDTDLADHVNNAAYWELLEEELIRTVPGVSGGLDAEIEFRDGAQPGPASYVADGPDRRVILGGAGELLATIALLDGPLRAPGA